MNMMALKRLFGLVALLTVLVSSIGFASPTVAQIIEEVPANEAAEYCRDLDAQGLLDDMGRTRGECVNFFKTSPSANANNFIAAVCGNKDFQKEQGTTNKGQCIKVLEGRAEEEVAVP
jgi:muconolactone delta-isomerase